MAREINLVPDIKIASIKAIKLRNLTFFICIVVAIGSVAASLVFAGIAAGQQAIVDSKKNTIENLSKKVNSYSDLSKFLTIKDQLNGLSEISKNKKVLSRIFNVLSALIPTGNDTIKISKLDINLENEPVAIMFDAQANAGNPPYYDYRVLDAFNKSLPYMRYDYGDYVDKEGNKIPAYCMIEYSADGSNFKDAEKGIYAYWLITGEGCNPSIETETEEDEEEDSSDDAKKKEKMIEEYKDELEEYEGQTVVRIWRTPQFEKWYKEDPEDEDAHISLDGEIYNTPHFESRCITYSGIENYQSTGNPSETAYTTHDKITWVGVNSDCKLIAEPEESEGEDEITGPTESSNGRSETEGLVLRFSAIFYLDPAIFSFENKHMIAIGPSSRFNVTDSFVQIQSIFSKPAKDCLPGDKECNGQDNQDGGNDGE